MLHGISTDDDHHWVLSKVEGSKLRTDESREHSFIVGPNL